MLHLVKQAITDTSNMIINYERNLNLKSHCLAFLSLTLAISPAVYLLLILPMLEGKTYYFYLYVCTIKTT